jgi:hypothetical protein
MVLTDSRIKFFAEQVGLGASELKNKLQELDRQFQECSLQRDWMGCLAAIKKQNRLLGLCPIETDSDEDDGIALLTAIRIVSPTVYNSIIQKFLTHDEPKSTTIFGSTSAKR